MGSGNAVERYVHQYLEERLAQGDHNRFHCAVKYLLLIQYR